jgi:uncharacterized membrane protein
MTTENKDHKRFLEEHLHLTPVFGNDWFALKAEAFARFFGTPIFIIAQTIFVTVWILLNVFGIFNFDLYPFILLNLAFSTQAAYAAPLILLAQTRQADRDKAHAAADAQHRDSLAIESANRQALISEQTAAIMKLTKQNSSVMKAIREMNQRIEILTQEVHAKVTESK